MRGAISKKRGSQPRWPEKAEGMEKSKRARKRKLDTAKTDLKPPLAVLRRAGCPPRVGRKRWKFLHTHEVGQSSHSNGHAILRAHYNSRRDKSCRCCQHNSNCDHERRQVSANFAHRYRNVRTAFITVAQAIGRWFRGYVPSSALSASACLLIAISHID